MSAIIIFINKKFKLRCVVLFIDDSMKRAEDEVNDWGDENSFNKIYHENNVGR